jgi:hypothetical protein
LIGAAERAVQERKMAGQEETNSRGRAKVSRRNLSKSVARAEFLAGERGVQKELAADETLLSTSVPAQMDHFDPDQIMYPV